MARAGELGVDQAVSFLREVDEINLRRRARTVDLGLDLVGGSYQGSRVAVLGAAFKPDRDDIRDSPALDVAAAISRQGATSWSTTRMRWTTPAALHPELDYAVSLDAALDGADLVLLLTEWAEFRAHATRPRSAASCASAMSSTAGTCSTPSSGARPAGTTARSAGPSISS